MLDITPIVSDGIYKHKLTKIDFLFLFCRNKKEVIMSWGVTKHWSVSYGQATQLQRDQCQNFSQGHNFCHSIVDCSQIRKK